MDSHKNARLTARSRELLARKVVEQGVTLKLASTRTSAGIPFVTPSALC